MASFQQIGVYGEEFTIRFGTNLESNPPAFVSITQPNGIIVVEGVSFSSEDVLYSISNLTFSHTGIWICNITVEEFNITQPGGQLFSRYVVGERSIAVNVSVLGKIPYLF